MQSFILPFHYPMSMFGPVFGLTKMMFHKSTKTLLLRKRWNK